MLRYGRLIIYVFNEVIFLEFIDGNVYLFFEVFVYWIGCGNLVSSIIGSDGEVCVFGVCIYDDEIEGFCMIVVGMIFGFVDLLVIVFEFDIGFCVGGSVMFF